MVRMKLTTDLRPLGGNSARDTQNTVKHHEKGMHLSPGIWVRDIPTTPVNLTGSVTAF